MSQIDYFTEERSVEAVNARMGDEVTPRLREVMASPRLIHEGAG